VLPRTAALDALRDMSLDPTAAGFLGILMLDTRFGFDTHRCAI